MSFPIQVFLYAYAAFLILWLVLSLIGFYHLVRFGGRMFGSFFVGVIYIAGVLCIAYLSYFYLMPLDWQTEIHLFSDTSFFTNNPIVPQNPF